MWRKALDGVLFIDEAYNKETLQYSPHELGEFFINLLSKCF
jgi:hypothetical protein